MSTWVTHTGVVTMIAVVVLYSLRIGVGVLRGTAISWDAELTHLGMGLAMAGMFDRTFALVPPQVWLAFFGGAGAWFVAAGLTRRPAAVERAVARRHARPCRRLCRHGLHARRGAAQRKHGEHGRSDLRRPDDRDAGNGLRIRGHALDRAGNRHRGRPAVWRRFRRVAALSGV